MDLKKNLNKHALLIIDMQNYFFHKSSVLKNKENKLVENINQLIEFMSNKDLPIIHIKRIHKCDGSDRDDSMKEKDVGYCMEGTKGAEELEGLHLDVRKHHEIKKTRYSGFFRTKLEALLKKLKVDTLIIAGINTHACIRTTAFDGFQRDYKIIIPIECIASYDIVHENITLKYFEKYFKLKSNTEIMNSI